MYDIALSVAACLRAGTRVNVAWVVETHGFDSRDHAESLALTPGGGRVGAMLAGALDDQLAALDRRGVSGRLVDLHVDDVEALIAGLNGGGDARCLLVSATDLPEELWERLEERAPICLVSFLDGDVVTSSKVYDADTIDEAGAEAAELFKRGFSATVLSHEAAVTVLWPVPKLIIVGAGAVAGALQDLGARLDWQVRAVSDIEQAVGLLLGLATLDSVVVIGHDEEVAGRALAAALSGGAGYIGALGGRRVQEARAAWLTGQGITDLERIHGPAGLDLGAKTAAETALSILGESLVVRSGATGRPLRERGEVSPASGAPDRAIK